MVTRPGKLSQNPLEISACDPPRKTEPKPVGDFGLLTRPGKLSQNPLEISAC